MQLLAPLGVEAVVLYGKTIRYETLNDIVNKANKRHKKWDVEILLMHPDTEDEPLPINYTFNDCPLIIIQRKSTLEKARFTLKSKTNYYDYYK